jgi:hypothetical protein
MALFFKEVRLLSFGEYGRNICDTDSDFYPFDWTVPQPVRINSDVPQEESSSDSNAAPKDTQRPPPLRSVLTRPVLVSIANYAMLSLFETVSLALIPLIWSTSVRFGGLSMSKKAISDW